VNSARGGLKVKVNGKRVDKVRGEGVHSVIIPLGLLEEENVVELKSTTPLLPLWANKHEIGKVVLREEYMITQNRVSRDLEIKQDLESVQKAVFKFDTDCFSDDDLVVFVNEEELFRGKLCEGFEKDVIENLKEQNKITFASDGNYFIEDIKVDIGVKQESWPVYYFDVPEKKLEGLVNLRMHFNETGEKRLTVYLNGEALSIETRQMQVETAVTRYLLEGQNSIIFIPETELTLDKVELV